MGAAPIQHANLVIEANNDEVDIGNEGMNRFTVLEIFHFGDWAGFHGRPWFTDNLRAAGFVAQV
jgi:hypothetical protein